MPNHYAGDLRRTLAMYGLSHVRTELPHLLVIPFLTPHPVESNRMAGFPTCGEIVHGHIPVSGIQRSELLQDRGICTHDRISGSFSSSPAFIDHRMRAMPQEYADESGSRTLQI